MGRRDQGMDRPGVRQVPEGSGEQGKMEKTGCEIICGATATLTVKGQMMMLMMMMMKTQRGPCDSLLFFILRIFLLSHLIISNIYIFLNREEQQPAGAQ